MRLMLLGKDAPGTTVYIKVTKDWVFIFVYSVVMSLPLVLLALYELYEALKRSRSRSAQSSSRQYHVSLLRQEQQQQRQQVSSYGSINT